MPRPARRGQQQRGFSSAASRPGRVDFNANYDCPTPYVELAPPPEGDEVFSRVWQCPATKYAIGMVKREHGNGPGGVRGCRNDRMGGGRATEPRPAVRDHRERTRRFSWPLLCDFATSVHGGEGPVNALTRIMHEEPILGETQEPPCGTNVVFITF